MTRQARYFLFFTLLAIFLLVGIFSLFVAQRVEFETRRAVERAIPIQDMGWVRSDVDGMVVRLHGEAPSDEARFRVLEAVSNEINVNRISNNIIAPEVNLDEPELSLEIVQNSHMSSIIGLLPKEPSPVPIYHALERVNPTVSTLNLVGNLEGTVDESWEEKVDFIAYVIGALPNVKISANEEGARIECVAPDQAKADEQRAEILSRAPEGYEVILDVAAPRPLVVPFEFTYKKQGDALELKVCSATDEDDLSRIQASMSGAPEDGFKNCQLGLGAPTEDWGLLISELNGKLDPLNNFSFTVRDNQVVLDYSDQEDEAMVESVKKDVLGSLPPGFGFETNKIVTVKSIEELTAEGTEILFDIQTDIDGRASVSGVVGSRSMEANVESLVGAKFGTENTRIDLGYVEGLPPSWEKRIFATLNAVGAMNQAHAVLSEDFLSLEGSISSDELKDELLDQLKSEIGDLALVEEIALLDVESSALAKTVNPNECVTRLGEIMNEAPIQFEPSSSRISQDSRSTITSISQVLHECRAHDFEIGGHTDSKGSEDVNERISQERADAVLEAVFAQALEYGNIVATGFGETLPIATNDTEEGRAENRRIEIRLSVN